MASAVADTQEHQATGPTTVPKRPALSWFLSDAIAMARRYVIGMGRTPDVLAFVIVQPIIFVLLFRYIFGGSIHIRGVSYVNFLICGLIVQTVAFSSQPTAVALATDLHSGIIERFRSLAMSRAAVLAGRSLSDTIRYAFATVLMIGIGYAVGLRIHGSPIDVVAAIGLLALFGLSMSCLMACLAFSLKSPEAVVAASFPILGLLIFPSNVYASPHAMPEPLRAYATHQPVSEVTDAVRALLLGGPTSSHVLQALGWSIGIAVVLGALAVQRYRKAA
jgi:ABC-2 type transport system permease protein/oleandomycin transport system permease protein